MTTSKKLIYLLGILSTATILTLLSSFYSHSYKAAVSEGCPVKPGNYEGYCYEYLPAGGFPFPFLFDNAFTDTKGTLGFDDKIQPFLFMGDFLAFAFPLLLMVVGIYVYRNREKT